MPIIGSSASPKGVPGVPTIDSVTAGNGSVSVTFSSPGFSKLPITLYTVTASPGGATGTGVSSPIIVSGLSNGTAYTFTLTASHANGQSAASAASNSATPVEPVYTLSQTFNASGTFTVPAGKNLVAAYTFGGGGNGAGGLQGYAFYGGDNNALLWIGGAGGAGGGAGGAVAFKGVSANSGTNFAVTVGGANGASSFGNLATANGGGRPSGGSGSSNVPDAVVLAGASGGNGAGGGGGRIADNRIVNSYNAGNATVGQNLTLTGTGLGSIQAGGGGGGGGGGNTPSGNPSYGPTAGQAVGGGSGGEAATQLGGGGGGRGGNADGQANWNYGDSGGAGGAGKVVVYVA